MGENRTYYAEVIETSRDFSARERIKIKDTSDATSLDNATKIDNVMIDVESWATLKIHNDKSEDKEYITHIIFDRNGEKFKTGSNSFWNSFISIWDELSMEDEPIMIKAYRLPSKNRQGKDFITCSLV